MIVALALVAVAVVAIVAQAWLSRDHARHVDALLARVDAERYQWARERWELNTRIQSPELARMAPPAPPTPPAAAGDGPELEDDEPDESHLVGMFAPPSDRGDA